MKRKKSPVRAPSAQPAPPPQPVMQGNAFATFLREAQSIGNEVEARRRLQNEVGLFLAERGLVEEFESWRAARSAPPAV